MPRRLIALLVGSVLYLIKRRVKGAALFLKLRASKLGPKSADWAEANQAKLLAEPSLQAPKAIPALLREEAEQKAALAGRVAKRQVAVNEAELANVQHVGVETTPAVIEASDYQLLYRGTTSEDTPFL